MLISVAEARKAPGQVFGFSFEMIGLGPIVSSAGELLLTKPVSIVGGITADTEGISVSGTLKTAFQTVCARCLKLLEEPIGAAFDVRFHKASDDDDVYLYEGDSLDITNMIRDHVLLAIPLRNLCRVECKGLCQTCGANLNEVECDCVCEE